MEVFSRKTMLAGIGGLGAITTYRTRANAAQARVIGAWRLETFDMVSKNGKKKPFYGPNPVGYLIYTPTGCVSATLQNPRRAGLMPPGVAQNETHCVESVGEFLAYAGRYEIRGNRVFHKLETCVYTNLVGTTLEREFELRGDILVIKTIPPYIWADESILRWRRT